MLPNVTGMGKLFTTTGSKNNFIFKFHINFSKENIERKLCEEVRDTFLGSLSTYLLVIEFHFDAILCFNFCNDNSDAGHVKCLLHLACRPQVLYPCYVS